MWTGSRSSAAPGSSWRATAPTRWLRALGLVRPVTRLQRVGVVAHFAAPRSASRSGRSGWPPRGAERAGVAGFCDQGRSHLSCVLQADRGSGRRAAGVRLGADRPLPRGGPRASKGRASRARCDVPCFGHRLCAPLRAGSPCLLGRCAVRRSVYGRGHPPRASGRARIKPRRVPSRRATSPRGRAPYEEDRRELARPHVRSAIWCRRSSRVPVSWGGSAATSGGDREAARCLIGALVDVLPPQAILTPRFLRSVLLP